MKYDSHFQHVLSHNNHAYLSDMTEAQLSHFFSFLKKITYNDLAVLRSPPSAIKDCDYGDINYVWNTHFAHLSDIKNSDNLSDIVSCLFRREGLNQNYSFHIYKSQSIDDYITLTRTYLYHNADIENTKSDSLFEIIKNKVLGIEPSHYLNYFDIFEKPNVENFKNSYELIKRYGFNTVSTGVMGNHVCHELISESKQIFENFLATLNCKPQMVSLDGRLSFNTETRPSILEHSYEGFFLPEKYKLSDNHKELGVLSLNVMHDNALNNYVHELTHAVDFLIGKEAYITGIKKNIQGIKANQFYSDMPESFLNIIPKIKVKIAKLLDYSYNHSPYFKIKNKEITAEHNNDYGFHFIKAIIMRTFKAKNIMHIDTDFLDKVIRESFPQPDKFLTHITDFYTNNPEKTFIDFINKNEYILNSVKHISQKLNISLDYDLRERLKAATHNIDSAFLDKVLSKPDKFSNSYNGLIPVIHNNIQEKEYIKYRLKYHERIAFGVGDNFSKNSVIRSEFLSLIRYCIPELKDNLIKLSTIEDQTANVKKNKEQYFLNFDNFKHKPDYK